MDRKTNRFEGLKLLYLQKTRVANPSEWTGLTEQNEKLYVRFLTGELFVGTGQTLDQARHTMVPVMDFGDDETDFLTTENLLKVMKWRKTVIEPKYSQQDYDS